MNINANYKVNELVETFSDKTGWNLARVKLLVALICAACKLQTVNFQKLAQGLGGDALLESNLRRIQRFFAEFIEYSCAIRTLIPEISGHPFLF